MIVVQSLDELKGALSNSCVTIGNFDGVHKGHQKLINLVTQRARRHNMLSVVVTFEPHPLRVLTGKKTPPFITLLPQKLELISDLGIEVAMVLPFTRALAGLDPETFVLDYLVDGLHMKSLLIGYDYAFGKNRAGNFEMLTALGEKYDFDVERLDPVIVNDAVVSSTRIRDSVQAGRVWDARDLLGRFYQVRGEVVHGAGRGGKALGFPTANLRLDDELVPRKGVYAVWAEAESLGPEPVAGVTNVGVNPTFGENELSVEVHVLDSDKDLYGDELKVHFVQRIRDEQKFSGPDELIARINEDIRLGRQILGQSEARL